VHRALAKSSIRALMWEGRHFLSWYTARRPAHALAELNIGDIDIYFEMRAAGPLVPTSARN
jgi:integrase/recombinase XerD